MRSLGRILRAPHRKARSSGDKKRATQAGRRNEHDRNRPTLDASGDRTLWSPGAHDVAGRGGGRKQRLRNHSVAKPDDRLYPDGQPPPAGAHIKLRQPDGTLAGQAAVAPDTGAFTLGPAPNARHALRAVSADATIVGDLVVQSGDSVIAASGWASAQINGAPVENGTSNIPVPSGKARRLRRTFGQFPLPGLWRSN
jgi:hypothetical protein